MSDLVRFGVAMERGLLADFDRRIAERGYENRSEAIRDLVRADLVRAAYDQGATVVATITVVFAPHVRGELLRLCDVGPHEPELILASQHVRIDPARHLETFVVRAKADKLTELAGKIAGVKGVLSCETAVAAAVSTSG
ncbi:MAG TPA: nickel-responsive transcriptional regulator NikR [Polyangium sp.]|nr:nickel-responsive transcriptional regulator NikR [Polyangium sp.]